MMTIAKQWESYRKAVIPKDASKVQLHECRLAFYAGATAHLRITDAIADRYDNEEDGVRELAKLHDEIKSFVKESVYD